MPTRRYARSRRYEVAGADPEPKPLLRVRLRYAARSTPQFLALVDSGAAVSLFHAELARTLGIDLQACRAVRLGGLGAALDAYVCHGELDVEGVRFEAEIHFIDGLDPPIALLGRRDVFQRFQFGFDHRGRRVLFDPY